MQTQTKKLYCRPALEDRGQVTQQTLQSLSGAPESTDPVQQTGGSPI